MSRYKESTKQCAEFLRLVIPFLAKHKLAANPFSYTVCYEYIAGINPPLKKAIDNLLDGDGALNDGLIEELYETFVAGQEVIRSKEVREGIAKLIRSLSESTANAGEGVSQFDQSLRQYDQALDDVTDSSALHQIITDLLGATQSMRESTESMRAEMEKSQREIENLHEKLNAAQAEALTDPMTGLANRKGLSIAAEDAIAKATETKEPLSLLMADIDHFKRINDAHGHLLGDKVIKFLGATLKKQIKGKDTAARFGGEEFAILLPDTPLAGARSVAEKIRTELESARIRRSNNGQDIGQITISLGVARYRHGESIDDLIGRADAALYRSKNEGRNRVTVDEGDDAG